MKASGYEGKRREDLFVATIMWGSFILAAGIPIVMLLAELAPLF